MRLVNKFDLKKLIDFEITNHFEVRSLLLLNIYFNYFIIE